MKKMSLMAGGSALFVYLMMSICTSLYASQTIVTKAQNDEARVEKIAQSIELDSLSEQVSKLVNKAQRHKKFKAKIN